MQLHAATLLIAVALGGVASSAAQVATTQPAAPATPSPASQSVAATASDESQVSADPAALQAALADPARRVAALNAAWSLSELTPELRADLTDLLTASSPRTRHTALALLVTKSSAADCEVYLERLRDRRAPLQLRFALAELCALVDAPAVRAALRDAAASDDPVLHQAAVAALDRTPRAESDAAQPHRWLEAELRAARLENRLTATLQSHYLLTPADQQPALLQQLLADDEPAVARLALALARGRLAENRTLAPETIAACRALLQSPDPHVRGAAAHTITSLRDAEDAAVFAQRLQSEPDPRVVVALLNGLGYVGDGDTISVLKPWLERPEPEFAFEAFDAVGRLGERGLLAERHAALVPIILEFVDEWWETAPARRERMLWTLTRVDDVRFAPLLERGMTDTRPGVQTAAARGTGELLRVTEPGDLDPELRAQLVTDLIQLTVAPDVSARLAAIDALGVARVDGEAAEALWQRTQPAIEPEARVRAAAWHAYVRVVAQQPVEKIVSRLQLLPPTGETLARRAELIEAAIAHHTKHPGADGAALGRLRALLAEARAAAGQIDAALLAYRKSLETLHAVDAQLVQETSAAFLTLALLSGRYDAQLGDLLSKGNPPFAPDVAAEAARQGLETLLERKEFERAAAMHALLTSNPPAVWNAAMQDWLAGYAERMAQHAQRHTREQTAAAIDTLLAQPDAEAPRAVLEARPRQAKLQLLKRLETALAAGETTIERRLLAILTQLQPSWDAYQLEADPADRSAAIAALRAQLRNPSDAGEPE